MHLYIYFICMHSNFLLNFKAQNSQFYDNRLLWDSERMSTVDVYSANFLIVRLCTHRMKNK